MGRTSALPAGVPGTDGQVGAVPTACVAAGCDGGPHPDFRPDSCRNDGRRGSLPGGSPRSALQPVPDCPDRDRRGGHAHLLSGGIDRPHPDGPEEGAGVQHRLAARIHDAGHGLRSPCRRTVPPGHPRLFQGDAVPGIGLSHPRHGRGGRPRTGPCPGHAADGWFAPEDAGDCHHLFHWLHRDQRHPPPGRVLEQGRNSRPGLKSDN